jgi:hypothetical protein
MKRARLIKKNGVHVNAVVTQINPLQSSPGRTMVVLLMEYKDRATGQPYSATATVTHHKYQVGDNFPIVYHTANPSIYVLDVKNHYRLYLILCSLLFILVVFAVYKIKEKTDKKHEETILKVNGTPDL